MQSDDLLVEVRWSSERQKNTWELGGSYESREVALNAQEFSIYYICTSISQL
jgi:hypothetical protein